MLVYRLGKGYESLTRERGHRRYAGTARDSLCTAIGAGSLSQQGPRFETIRNP